MPDAIDPVTTYQSAGHSVLDLAAESALRLPLLENLLMMPPADRHAWLASLIEGLHDSIAQDGEIERRPDAYAIGRRMTLLLKEQGHACL
ncbi:hypothetical protein [Streptomyces sp. H27-D2]|uniref:hypothetical protein n=1 Tax=Streptomyces sp. H27-D2 TaxID=3046304 RepID=UPI002DB98704|nr:hypothetical protein [Streptomyces sp. H27-D2]MEC4016050.1 hypothetical protein [Streptomyces sp. H27-D2]